MKSSFEGLTVVANIALLSVFVANRTPLFDVLGNAWKVKDVATSFKSGNGIGRHERFLTNDTHVLSKFGEFECVIGRHQQLGEMVIVLAGFAHALVSQGASEEKHFGHTTQFLQSN